jgi:hypothetical protein
MSGDEPTIFEFLGRSLDCGPSGFRRIRVPSRSVGELCLHLVCMLWSRRGYGESNSVSLLLQALYLASLNPKLGATQLRLTGLSAQL